MAGSDTAAYFKVGFPTGETSFIIKLTNPDRIQQAREILSGALNRGMHVSGLVVKSPAPYNSGWSYHLDPVSIGFFDFATEVCDANPYYIEEHLDEVCGAFLPDCRWCPWSSKLLAEVTFVQLYLPILLR
ncbi:MAG: calmodulin [Chloroflexi bacterium]|nr:calmodulin [Chloroflexota bacterium]